MTLEEARNKLSENQYLIGTTFKGDIISELVIIPTNNSNISDIVMCVNFEQHYEQFLVGHSDFYISAFLNFDQYPNEGVLFSYPLDVILNIISEQ